MNRPLNVASVLVALLVWALVSHALDAATPTDRWLYANSAAHVASGICAGASWAPRVSITRNALRELRERMANYGHPTGICITGPLQEDCRAPDSIEEAWLIEKLYGPPQRWILDIVPLEELLKPLIDPGERFHVEQVCGITVGILTTKTVSWLSVELHGDAIRVREPDA